MLDQLIESKNHSGEKNRRGSFLLSVFTAVFSALTFALIYSLFSYNLAMASDKLEISTLVAPVNVPAEAPPPPPETTVEPKPATAAERAPDKLPSRQENIQRIEEVPVEAPTEISAARNTKASRPNGKFIIGSEDSGPAATGIQTHGRNSGTGSDPNGIEPSGETSKVIDSTPPPLPPVIKKPETKTVTPPAAAPVKTGGVLNGKAVKLIKPQYPATAKAVQAGGTVNVQVTIDENGNVTSANAVSGHPFLRQASEQAARSSKFSSTLLGGQKVKVTGVIVYNFIPQ